MAHNNVRGMPIIPTRPANLNPKAPKIPGMRPKTTRPKRIEFEKGGEEIPTISQPTRPKVAPPRMASASQARVSLFNGPLFDFSK